MTAMTRISARLRETVETLYELPEEEQELWAELIEELKLARLRRAIEEGLQSGPATDWDVDEFLAAAHARLEARPGTQE
jgi:Arc/MetJ-type ribon-helix-helix transcriptional regulator